jgi:hypothetical protein
VKPVSIVHFEDISDTMLVRTFSERSVEIVVEFVLMTMPKLMIDVYMTCIVFHEISLVYRDSD